MRLRGPGNGHPVVKKAPTAADLFEKGPSTSSISPANPLRPGCTYAPDGRRFAAGQPSLRTPTSWPSRDFPGKPALQYWFYYYFNDYNNKHESDWEGIQVVFTLDTGRGAR